MKNVVIIGSGPAGVSAALYTARAGIETTVIYKGIGALEKAEGIQNYYGFADAPTGTGLAKSAIEGAKKVGVKFVQDEVVGIDFNEKLEVETATSKYSADAILIATGTSRAYPPGIKGIKELEGKGVGYCAVCDAFFYRGKDVCILGTGEYAIHEINALKPVANSITLLTNGAELTVTVPEGVEVITDKVEAIIGEEKIEKVLFKNQNEFKTDGLFIAYGVAGSTAIARKIGAQVDGNKVVVDENMATTIPGLYAAGDCTGGMLQVAKAVYEGAKAGTEIVKYLN